MEELKGQVRPGFHLRPVQFEDLLGREEIKLNMELIGQQLSGKTILITGAAGSIGSELVRQLTAFSPGLLILLDAAENPLYDLSQELDDRYPEVKYVRLLADIRNRERLEHVFRRFRPQVIYHAAAYKHVPMMEWHPTEAALTNILGTRQLADLALEYGSERFVMISTDKAVNPTSVMGASKRVAEIYLQSLAKKSERKGLTTSFVTTRFGNVLGSNGSVIPLFQRQIETGGPVTVTDPDIVRYFMTIPEACRLVLEAASFGQSGLIYVFDMGKPVKILDLALNLIRMSGLEPYTDIQIEFKGLRQGEKLYEELLSDKETTIPTQHQKILVAKVREYDYKEVVTLVDDIINQARANEAMETVKAIKKLVPEYVSQHSPYEVLDQPAVS